MAMRVRLADIRLPIARAHAIAMHAGEHRREEEQDGVDDAKGEARLEHGARLVDLDVDAVEGGAAEDAEAQVDGGPADHARAVGVGYEAEGVHGADEGADEEEVDDGHEDGVCGGAVVREEGEDGPGAGEDRDDEEDEDGVWCQRVGIVVPVYEVG